ncbi:MAG: InlB B-repeat-containing protein [Clostridia bacterium]|nr:InlB B-repeat-containing protein [Clostridia bacterium]
MRKSNHGISLILVLVLVLVLSVAVLAGCNGLSIPGEDLNGDLGGGEVSDVVPGGDDVPADPTAPASIAPTVAPLAYSMQNSDESQMLECDEFVLFDITSSATITSENVGTFVEVIDRNGDLVAIQVNEYDGIYVIKRPDGESYIAGATYTINLLDEVAFFTGKSETLRSIKFTINKDYAADAVLQDGIVLVNPQNVSVLSAGLKDADNDIYGLRLELIVPYDVSSEAAAIERFAVGNLFVIAKSFDEVTADSTFGKVCSEPLTVQGGGTIVVVFDYVAPSMEEIYSALDIFVVEEVDCSEIAIDEEIAEAASASVRQSQMFYDFAEAVWMVSDEAKTAGIMDTVTGFLDNFKIATEIKHEGRGFALAFSIEYLSDADANGKCMYAKVAYGGNITYDIKAYAELDGTNFYYDYALIVNTDHTLTISIQWIDSESDTLVTNDEELAQKIADILADRTVLSGTIFGDAKAISKEFTVPLIQTLTYIIPNTPITINLDLNWFISFEIQAELYNETVITSVDTIGVRSVADENGDLVPEQYQTRVNTLSNDTMLFGTLTMATGVNADAYFSIVGMSKWLRVGIDARVGVYLELDGVFAKTEATDDNIKTAAGEFGWFVSAALEYKVFILSGKPVGVEAHGVIATFGQDIITLGWNSENSDTIVLDEIVNSLDTDTILTLSEIDLPAYESNKSYLTFVNPIEVDNTWTAMNTVYSVDDFDYSIATVGGVKVATMANGCVIVLSAESFETTMTMTLKADAGVSKTFTLSYTAPVVEEVVETPTELFTINFNANGGTSVASITEVEYLSATTLPTATTRTGYIFAGWYYNGVRIEDSIFTLTVASDVTVIAKWNQFYENAIYVSTAAQLKAVANDLDATYYLENDINLGGAEWTPIGTASEPFAGYFMGNNHKVYGFKITKAVANAGLFGYVVKGTQSNSIVNLNVSNATIGFTAEKMDVNAGIIAGVNENIISGCSVTSSSVSVTMKGSITVNTYNAYAGGFVGVNKGTVSGTNSTTATVSAVTNNAYINLYVGGFAALNEGTITGSSSAYGTPTARNTNSVNFSETYSAGLVAINNATISGAYVYGSYTLVSEKQGGLVAENNGNINNSKVAGSFTFTVDNVGGIAGVNNSSITSCFANYITIKANDENNVGGIVGKNNEDASVTGCSSTGTITGADDVGGVVGENDSDGIINTSSSTANLTATNKGIFGVGAGSTGSIYGND